MFLDHALGRLILHTCWPDGFRCKLISDVGEAHPEGNQGCVTCRSMWRGVSHSSNPGVTACGPSRDESYMDNDSRSTTLTRRRAGVSGRLPG
jgi:hypothetical protein